MRPSSVHERRVVNRLVNKAWFIAKQDEFLFGECLLDVCAVRAEGIECPEQAERFAHAVMAREGLNYVLRQNVSDVFIARANVIRRDGLQPKENQE